MGSPEFERVMLEIVIHPKEREGFRQNDLEALRGEEREQVLHELFVRIESGQGLYHQPLIWMLGHEYTNALLYRLSTLPSDAGGRVYLPFYLYKATGDQQYLERMIGEIVAGKVDYRSRNYAFSSALYLRSLIGKKLVYWDLCRYLILNDASLDMRKEAMLWLAYEKGVPGVAIAYKLPTELTECVERLYATHGQDPQALAVLNQLHQDTGHLRIDEKTLSISPSSSPPARAGKQHRERE